LKKIKTFFFKMFLFLERAGTAQVARKEKQFVFVLPGGG
jgi:hypothetical protein